MLRLLTPWMRKITFFPMIRLKKLVLKVKPALVFVPSAQKSTTALKTTSSSYCVDLVRKHDYEMFLCTLLLPDADLRTRVMAVRAFNAEIALVRDQVSQKDIGLARLSFWRDVINQLYTAKQEGQKSLKTIARQPAALELSRIILEKNVSKKWIMNLIEGRERVLSDSPFRDIADLETYSDQTVTPIIYISLEMMEVKDVKIDHAASHLGKAIGITNFIRSIPYNAHHRRVLVPQELIMKHKLSQENFIRNDKKEQIGELIYELASQAHIHYEKAKSMKGSITKNALPLFLSGVPAEIYLKRLQRVHFNPYDPSLTTRYGLLPWHLFTKKLTRAYF